MFKLLKDSEEFIRIEPAPERGTELTGEVRQLLIREALRAVMNSYAPYSHYNVGAAALMASGRIYTGANIESALLSCTVCAERNAIHTAAACGERRLIAIAIVGGPEIDAPDRLLQYDYCTPCGMCRQVMMDFADPDSMTVICAKSERDYREWTLGQLLPEGFGPANLG